MKTHRTDGISFTFGLVFLVIVVCYVAGRLVDLNLPTMGWLVAGGLILLGMAGLVGTLRSGRANPMDEPVPTTLVTEPETSEAPATPPAAGGSPPGAPD